MAATRESLDGIAQYGKNRCNGPSCGYTIADGNHLGEKEKH